MDYSDKRHPCPDGWLQLFTSCYKINLQETTFVGAIDECARVQGFLFHPETFKEYKFLLYTYANAYNKSFWIAEEFYDNVTCHYVENMGEKNGSCHDMRSFICGSSDYIEENCGALVYSQFLDKCFFWGPLLTRQHGQKYCEDKQGNFIVMSNVLYGSYAQAFAAVANSDTWIGNTQQENDQCLKVTVKGEFIASSSGCNELATPLCERPTGDESVTLPSTTIMPTTYNPEQNIICPPDPHWISHRRVKYCYLESSYIFDYMTWHEARNFCRSLGADLASYADFEEEGFVLDTISGIENHWIGLHRKASSGSPLVWSDGSPSNYTHWDEDEPNNESEKNCAAHTGLHSRWKMSHCGTMKWFLCKAPKGQYPPERKVYHFMEEPSECKNRSGHLTWFLFKDHCYTFKILNDKSWHTAKYFCTDNDANLASIHSPEENAFILSMIRGKGRENMWIGLSSLGLYSSFTWDDGSPLDFVNWDNDQQNNSVNLDKCVVFDRFSGFWTIRHCNTFLSVICKQRVNVSSVDLTASAESALPGFCPDEWYTLGNYCYKLFGVKATEKLSWLKARVKCAKEGAHLASIHNEKEQGFLTNLVMNAGHGTWIGLYAEERNLLYHWTDSSSLDYTDWNVDEPYNEGRPEDCVEMVFDELFMGKWNDVVCSKPKAFICKKIKNPDLVRPGSDPSKCTERRNWYKLGHSCFSEVFSEPLPWLESQAKCNMLGSNLPTIQGFGTTLFLKDFLPRQQQELVWLGARGYGISESNVYSWITQYPMSYTKWMDGQPRKVSYHDNCVAINSDGYWMVRDCREKLNFLCEFNREEYSLTTFSRSPTSCPNNSTDWIDLHVGSNCYHIVKEHQSYFEAMRLCFLKGGFLASFHSPEQLNAIAVLLKSMEWPVHIGLAQKLDGTYGWIDGSAVDYVHWEDGEPNSMEERCVEMDTKVLTWNDIKCSERRGFICSTPKIFIASDAAASRNFTAAAKHVRDQLTIGGIVSIIICMLVVAVIIGVTTYYICPPARCREEQRIIRISDEDYL